MSSKTARGLSTNKVLHKSVLQNHGEIYLVDDWVRITDPEAVEAEFVDEDGETEADSN